jgi:hypothetical protein
VWIARLLNKYINLTLISYGSQCIVRERNDTETSRHRSLRESSIGRLPLLGMDHVSIVYVDKVVLYRL